MSKATSLQKNLEKEMKDLARDLGEITLVDIEQEINKIHEQLLRNTTIAIEAAIKDRIPAEDLQLLRSGMAQDNEKLTAEVLRLTESVAGVDLKMFQLIERISNVEKTASSLESTISHQRRIQLVVLILVALGVLSDLLRIVL